MMQMQGRSTWNLIDLGSDMDGSPYGMEDDMMGDEDMDYGQEHEHEYGMEGDMDGSGQYG